MDTQLIPVLQSSSDPTGQTLAMKVQGLILGLSSVIILVAAQLFHIQLTANDIVSLAAEFGAVAGAIAVIFGALRHLIIWWGTIKKTV